MALRCRPASLKNWERTTSACISLTSHHREQKEDWIVLSTWLSAYAVFKADSDQRQIIRRIMAEHEVWLCASNWRHEHVILSSQQGKQRRYENAYSVLCFVGYVLWENIQRIKPLALELDTYSLAHHLCKMWIFYEPRRVTLGNIRHLWKNKRRRWEEV